MNHYKAVQRKDKRWDFVRFRDGSGQPWGYCRAFAPFTDKQITEWFISTELIKAHNARKHKYHTSGHSTPQEACACYRQFLLDTALRFRDDEPDRFMGRCKVCNEYTNGGAEVDHGDLIVLCKAHRTRDYVERLYPPVGEIWSST